MGKKPNKKEAARLKAEKKAALEAQRGAEAEAIESKEGVLRTAAISGILTSKPDSRDIEISHFSVANFGKELIQDATLTLTYGHRYGLIGQNGSGKSTLLQCLAVREVRTSVPDL
jgi:ATP-binding cassette subfamily F protein 2